MSMISLGCVLWYIACGYAANGLSASPRQIASPRDLRDRGLIVSSHLICPRLGL